MSAFLTRIVIQQTDMQKLTLHMPLLFLDKE